MIAINGEILKKIFTRNFVIPQESHLVTLQNISICSSLWDYKSTNQVVYLGRFHIDELCVYSVKITGNLYIGLTKPDLSPLNRVTLSDKWQILFFANT